jgi:excisionase family DNA binding protein
VSPNPYVPVKPNHRPSESFLSVPQVAELLSVSRMTIYRLVGEGVIPAHRIGRSIRIRERDFDAYLRDADMTSWVAE